MKLPFYVIAFLFVPVTSNAENLFQPDSASATSENSSSFLVDYVIDGSGMPPNFTAEDCHDDYSFSNNHWTTVANEVVGTTATFGFDPARTMNAMYLWNHRSNVIASNPFYEITQFDLIFRDVNGDVLLQLDDNTAIGNVAHSQLYIFPEISDVTTVELVIDENEGVAAGANPNFTGLAEIAFACGVTPPLVGDMNRDGSINLLDVAPFVEVLNDECGFQFEADTNGDGTVNLLDVASFVALLNGS